MILEYRLGLVSTGLDGLTDMGDLTEEWMSVCLALRAA